MSAPRPLLPTPDSTLPEAAWRREVAGAIARLVPVTGEVTLKAGAAETAVADRRSGPASVVLFTALLFIGTNLLVDLSYAVIDPRIRYS